MAIAWEDRYKKLSPEQEWTVERAVLQRESKDGSPMEPKKRENYKALLRYLTSLTWDYDD